MIFAILLSLAFANNLHKLPVDQAWAKWQTQFGEHECPHRYEAFFYNHALVRAHNSKPNVTFTLALNEFAHLTNEEFKEQQGFRGGERSWQSLGDAYEMVGNAPDSIDWRGKLVTPVKNQGQCGSCWTFSAVVSLEGQYAKLTNDLTSFSEQDFVDCVKNVKVPGSSQSCCDGCNGGLMDYAFQYMISNQDGADDTESSYPYTGKDGSCSFSQSGAFKDAQVTSFVDLKSEDELLDATANKGPISVAVNANIFWQLYHGGVLKPFSCPANKLDHGVAVVGYGTDSGKDYWIIKNSWGKTWGEDGYVRLNRGDNTCGVANGPPSYPVMSSK